MSKPSQPDTSCSARSKAKRSRQSLCEGACSRARSLPSPELRPHAVRRAATELRALAASEHLP
eukprot:6192228-Pleurochrysis_carterae.AAC.7